MEMEPRVEPLRHRQTKGAAADMFDLQPSRHTSTLLTAAVRSGRPSSVSVRWKEPPVPLLPEPRILPPQRHEWNLDRSLTGVIATIR